MCYFETIENEDKGYHGLIFIPVKTEISSLIFSTTTFEVHYRLQYTPCIYEQERYFVFIVTFCGRQSIDIHEGGKETMPGSHILEKLEY